MNDNIRAKMIELTQEIIARGERLNIQDDSLYKDFLDGLQCTCITYNGKVLAENNMCPVHSTSQHETP